MRLVVAQATAAGGRYWFSLARSAFYPDLFCFHFFQSAAVGGAEAVTAGCVFSFSFLYLQAVDAEIEALERARDKAKPKHQLGSKEGATQ